MLGYIACFIIAFAFWIYLNWTLDTQYLVFGVLVASAVAALSSRVLFNNFQPRHLHPKRLVYLMAHFIFFLKALIISNLTVCARILSPNIRIKPAVVKIGLESNCPPVIAGVANSITLTPGTLALDVKGGAIYIHCMHAERLEPIKLKRAIVDVFERNLRRVFE